MAEPKGLPEVVYHYTSMDTLLKIVDQQSIRATSIKYLNDVSERELFLELLRERLKEPKLSSKGENVLIEMALETLKRKQSFIDFPFVASFSRDSDSLPQWRAYCPNGNGVAIGFRTESLELAEAQIVDNSFATLKPFVGFEAVTYWTSTKQAGLDGLVTRMAQRAADAQAHIHGTETGWAEATVQHFASLIDAKATLTKHASFATEREYRLVVSHVGACGRVEYRSARSTLVPFVTLSLPDPERFLDNSSEATFKRFMREKPYLINQVVVGPTPHLGLSCDALEQLFRGRGHTVKIKASRVPYRDTI